MQNRDYIKWAPFNSVINDNVVLNELTRKRNKVYKPTLSEDQIDFLNEKIFEAYTNRLKVNIFVYSNFNIIKLTGFINNINLSKKYITFNYNHIYFNQILKITNFFEKNNEN